MKKTTLLFLGLFFTVMMQAGSNQTNLTVVSTAGGLAAAITTAGGNINTVTNLTVTGTIDAWDFKDMQLNMPVLAVLNLSGATIAHYSGTGGTASTDNISYAANEIPAWAFSNPNTGQSKASLTSIILPTSLISIGENAFFNCGYLTSLTIPPLVTTIRASAFFNCVGLKSITIPTLVTSIENLAFANCSGLSSITIPVSVTYIGVNAFKSTALITVDAGNSNYSSLAGILFNKTKTNLITCPTSKTGSYTIPSTVTSIGDYSFYNCIGLSSITIPASVTAIGNSAFEGCTGLTTINTYATTPVSLTSVTSVFLDVNTATCTLHVPVGSLATYQGAAQWSDFTINTIADLVISGVNNATVTALSLYPNPATDGFSIQAGEKASTISIYDLSGSLVLSQQIIGKSYINISSLQQGVYVVKADGLVGKLVKK